MAAPRPDLAIGQLWYIAAGDRAGLGLVVETSGDDVVVVPVDFSVELAGDGAVVADHRVGWVGRECVLWSGLATRVPGAHCQVLLGEGLEELAAVAGRRTPAHDLAGARTEQGLGRRTSSWAAHVRQLFGHLASPDR